MSAETGVLRVNINEIMPDGQYMVMYLCSEDQFLQAPCDLTMMKVADAPNKTFTLRKMRLLANGRLSCFTTKMVMAR